MNTTLNVNRLETLSALIHRLQDEVLQAERAAVDITCGEIDSAMAAARADALRAQMTQALQAYFIEAEFVRTRERRAA